MRMQFRAGDVLLVSCPFTPTVVTSVSTSYASVRWPWWQKDPAVDWAGWDGDVALARDRGSHDWAHELFRTEPAVDTLRAGDACRVGIPPTTVHVVQVQHFDPPQETGILPRPRRSLWVLHQGQSQDPNSDVDHGYSFDPDDDIPTDITLIFRPYAFLEIGDDIVDAQARAWRFDGPWTWQAYDGVVSRAPAWPLALLNDTGSGSSRATEAVAAATRHGSHETELARWRDLTKAEPPTVGAADVADGFQACEQW